MYQAEVKRAFVERYCNPRDGWEVFVDIDASELGETGGPRVTEEAVANQIGMQARGPYAVVGLNNLGVQVGGSRSSWFDSLRAKYPEESLPEVPGDRDIVAINPQTKEVLVAEAEGDSTGQPEQKLYKAIGQIVIAVGQTAAIGYDSEYVLAVSGEKIRSHLERAKILQRLGISAICVSLNPSEDKWLFRKSSVTGRRKERQSQFLNPKPGPSMHLSYPLVRCALSNLELALQDRCEGVYRKKDNHYSYHGVGSILALVAGFESLLNEIIDSLRNDVRPLATRLLISRYYDIPLKHAGKSLPKNRDLELLIEVRNEIAHGLPRAISEPHNVPLWLSELQIRGLFVTTNEPAQGDFALGWKIGSYKMCYWAWETISVAAKSLLSIVDEARMAVQMTVAEMERFREVCSPEKLVEFDKEYGLETSNW